MDTAYHIPVLLRESIDGLNIDSNGIYIDVTYGGGGHSRAILEKISTGKLIAFDQDKDALTNAIDDNRFHLIHSNFKYLSNFITYFKIQQVDGILADLGVSSHHFDTAERGFSFRFDSKLDMRMNQDAQFSAYDVVNDYDLDALKSIFIQYGELSNAYKLASAIVSQRKEKSIHTIAELVDIVKNCIPKGFENKFLAQLFQAIRIEVNKEMENLKEFLVSAEKCLKPGGRLVVITYHSLEDRLVKNFVKTGNFDGELIKDFYGHSSTPFEAINRKVIVPTDSELKLNSRARSAKLRIAEKKEISK